MKTFLIRHTMMAILMISLTGFALANLLGADWKVGDRVEAYNVSWYKVTILEVGAGDNEGRYLVAYDGFGKASNNWIRAKNIRPMTIPADLPKTGPRVGKYLIRSYVGKAIYPQGELELRSGGSYRVYLPGGKFLGEGTYEYSAKTGSVVWLTGIYQEEKRIGEFTITRAGKGHHIMLRPGTSAANEMK